MGPQGGILIKWFAGMGAQGAIADFQVHPLLRLSGFEGLWLHSPWCVTGSLLRVAPLPLPHRPQISNYVIVRASCIYSQCSPKLMCHRDGVTLKEYGDSSVEIWKTDGWKWNPISSLSGKFLRQRWQSTYSPLYSPAFPSSIPWIIEHRVLTKTEGMIFRWFLLKAFKSSKQKLRMMHS